MDLYFGDMTPPEPGQRIGAGPDQVLVGTASAVQLDVRPIEHHLTPTGAICIGTFHDGRALGRCAIPTESVEEFLEMDLFDRPVSLALNVRRGGPGVLGSVLALVPMEDREGEDTEEPWKSSVPGSDYERVADGPESDRGQLVGIFLGQVVRFEADRTNPDNLLREAADMLGSLIRGQVGSVVDRVIADLSRPEDDAG